ncbi:hypothetical protein [Microvirga sp. P5_D2]
MMSDLNDLPDCILDMLTRPTVETLVRFFPERTYVHTIHWSECLKEEKRFKQFLEHSGHPEWERINSFRVVADIFEGRLWDLANEHGVRPCHGTSGRNGDGDLEIVMVFASVKDAMVFKMALP